jgi:two-component system phosphate regulon sensor histidine kinase PhoR
MDLMSSSTGSADPIAEVRRLRRQLARERARRQAAESIGERATADLYDSVRELRTAQVELLDRGDQTRVVDDLSRALRQDLDSAHLVNRAAESVGRATSVDRCDVLLVDAHLYSAVQGTWSGSPEAALLPRPHSFVELPEALTALLLETAQSLAALQIEHIDADPRLDSEGATEILEALGVRALAAVPVAVGDEVVGWLLLQSVAPRAWQARELAICEGLSHDLVSSLIQVHAFEQQRESVRRLEELDRAKDAFISTVSHELRTPLTSIVGYLEMISEGGLGPLDDGVSQGMAIIERNVGRLRDLVEDLLTLSAYDAAKVTLDLQATDLATVIADCHQALVPAIDAKQLELAIVSAPDVRPALVDRTQIERVVLNLLSNAIKFSHDGGRVTIRLRPEGAFVVLSITDTGIGIPADEQQRLFSRFFRSSLAVADEIQGTGLGLTLVQAVVEWHDGNVEIDSVEGQGTTVTVRLPQTPVPESTPSPRGARES